MCTPEVPSGQFGDVSDEDGVAVEMYEVGFAQVVEHGGDGLAAGAGEAGDVLLGELVPDEGL